MNIEKNTNSRSTEFWDTWVSAKVDAWSLVIKLIDDDVLDDLQDLKGVLEGMIQRYNETLK